MAVRERLGDRELVEVAGVVVVDGRPEPIAQVAQVAGRTSGSADGRQFLPRGRREVRLQAALDHGLARDGGQGGPVALCVWIYGRGPVCHAANRKPKPLASAMGCSPQLHGQLPAGQPAAPFLGHTLPCARRHFVNGNRRIQRVAPRG